MKVYVNEQNEIHDVGSTNDTSLKEVILADGLLDSWSEAKLCCYCVTTDGKGNVTAFWPYVSTTVIEQLDRLGIQSEIHEEGLTDTQMALTENYEDFLSYSEVTDESIETSNTQITDLEMAVVELYEMIADVSSLMEG